MNPNTIGPFTAFSGRLLVMQPSKRWQVAIDWRANVASKGHLRLSHAMSATVVDFRWDHERMEVRDNKFPYWRPIQQQELMNQGIIIPPSQLASIVLNQMPPSFHAKKPGVWESRASGSIIRIRWQREAKILSITDLKHGRSAKLIIQ